MALTPEALISQADSLAAEISSGGNTGQPAPGIDP